jgi:hypothetical protein
MQCTKVFVCYSHEDQKWFLKDLLKHLKPFMQKYQVEIWYDQNIQPGEEWHQEIMRAIQTASVAVLIVSANFFASDFIEQHELPLLLTAAEQKKVRIVPVLLSACDYKDSCLEKFQLVNDPLQPLNCLPEGEQDKVWLKVAISVKEALAAYTVMPSVSASSYNHMGEKKKILENTAYQEALRMLNNQTLDSQKRTSTVLLLADMTEDLNEVEKQHLRGRLHRLRLDESLGVMQDYITLVLGLLGDVTVYNDMRTIFFRLHETLPLHLRRRMLECLAHQGNKSA